MYMETVKQRHENEFLCEFINNLEGKDLSTNEPVPKIHKMTDKIGLKIFFKC